MLFGFFCFGLQQLAAQDTTIASDTIATFRNSSLEFEFPYQINNKSKSWKLDTSGIYGPAIILFPPANPKGYSCYIYVTTQPQTGPAVSRDSMIRANVQFLPYSIEAFQLIKADSMDINGKEAFSLRYEGKQNGNIYRWWQTYIVFNGQMYAITYGATPEAFKEFEPVAMALTNSFKILD